MFKQASELLAKSNKSGPYQYSPYEGYPYEGAAAGRASGAATAGSTTAVPCEGLPATRVYPAAAFTVLAAAVGSFTVSQGRRKQSPATAEPRPAAASSSKAKPGPDITADEPAIEEARSYPALQSGPWNVLAAKAEKPGKGIWAPSKDSQFVNSDSFYSNRAKGHLRAGIGQRRRLGEKQGGQIKDVSYEEMHEPLERNGVSMLPVHVAAGEGLVWRLERCGATSSCRDLLELPDTVQDTPLHHAAAAGQVGTSKALLRLGALVDTRNGNDKLPEEVAEEAGHKELASMLRAVHASGDPGEALRHPDGLGCLDEPPPGVIFTGLKEAEPLRRAVNMAAGYQVTPPIPISRAAQEGPLQQAVRAADVVRGSLQGTEFEFEDVEVTEAERRDPWNVQSSSTVQGRQQPLHLRCCGLVLFEPPGAVTQDSPGNWIALRRTQQTADGSEGGFWRLDPVRGPFRLSAEETEALLSRYRAWRVIQGPGHLRAERAAKLARALEEAQALIAKKSAAGGAATISNPAA